MPDISPIAHLLTSLFDDWNKEGVRYLVLRNYERLPEETGNDVDILVDPAQRRLAESVLRKTADGCDWRIHNIADFACRSIFLHHARTLEVLHIDLMYWIHWHALGFSDHVAMLQDRRPCKNFYIPQPAHETAVNLMTRLVYGGYVKEAYRPAIRDCARTEPRAIIETLRPWIGGSLSEQITAAAAGERWDDIESQVGAVRRAVWKANLRNPVRLLAVLAKDVKRLLGRAWRPPGLFVVFMGPDGCGKTSVADGLKQRLKSTFYPEKGLHCHWKPVPATGEPARPTTDPHSRPPRAIPLSLLYFVYHYLAFVWGYWRYVHPALFRGGLVIVDRYYYDFLVDQRRYRLRIPNWIIRAGFALIKKPDILFALDAPVEVLQGRKCEVAREECDRQRLIYRSLAEGEKNSVIIDATQPLDDVINSVNGVILNRMTAATSRRLA